MASGGCCDQTLNPQEKFLICLTKLACSGTELSPQQIAACEGLVLASYAIWLDTSVKNPSTDATPPTAPVPDSAPPPTVTNNIYDFENSEIISYNANNNTNNANANKKNKHGKHHRNNNKSAPPARGQRQVDCATSSTKEAGKATSQAHVKAVNKAFVNAGSAAKDIDGKSTSNKDFEVKKQYTFGYDFNFSETGSKQKASSWFGDWFKGCSFTECCGLFSSDSKYAKQTKDKFHKSTEN